MIVNNTTKLIPESLQFPSKGQEEREKANLKEKPRLSE